MLKNKKIVFILILLLIFVDEKYFFIFSILDWRIPYLLLCLILYAKFGGKINKYKYNFKSFVYLYLVMLLVSALNVVLNGYLPLDIAFRNYVFIVLILLYFPFCSIVNKYGEKTVINAVISMSVVMSLILLIQSAFIGKLHLIEAGLSERDGEMRTVQGIFLIMFGIIFLADRVTLNLKKINIVNIILLMIMLYVFFYIFQTRSASFALIVALSLLFVLKGKKWIKKHFNPFFISVIFFIYGTFFMWQYANDILSTSLNENESSSVNRLLAYQYYWNSFLEHPLLGVGLNEGDFNVLLRKGIADSLYVQDIGFVGYIAQFGILGLTCLFILIISLFKRVRRLNRPLFISLGILLILMMPFSILLNINSGIIYIVFLMAMLNVRKNKLQTCFKKKALLLRSVQVQNIEKLA